VIFETFVAILTEHSGFTVEQAKAAWELPSVVKFRDTLTPEQVQKVGSVIAAVKQFKAGKKIDVPGITEL
jgi:hypothetical protein